MNKFLLIFKIFLAIPIIFVNYKLTTQIKVYHNDQFKKLKTNFIPLLHNILIENTPYHKFKQQYNETYLNMIEEPSYCEESDIYKLLHPDIL